MINPGDTVVNPVTGERLTFLKTSRETDGELVLIECVVRPDGFVAAKHVHPYQRERFEVVSGRLTMTAGRKKIELGPGESYTVEPGVAHKFENKGEHDVRFTCEVRPALSFEALIETMYGLAADGKTSKKGMPNPLRLAVIARHHFDHVRLPVVPHALQKAALAMGAPVGRIFGYDSVYVPAGGTPAPAIA
ncbi:MAG TPA: cupin domain-containing protein [Gaiellaceae bacterium]